MARDAVAVVDSHSRRWRRVVLLEALAVDAAAVRPSAWRFRCCSCQPRSPEPGTARVSVFDAGRGSAALVTTHSRVLLFDTGDSWNTRGARLRQLILPALDALGRRAVDVLVLPALNEDRAQGAALLAFERQRA